ncbi:MAG: DHH family phosphoesterase [Candidatus Paceibacterota bacterium]
MNAVSVALAPKRAQKFKEIITGKRNFTVLISHVDPDSLASAFTMIYLIKMLVPACQVKMFYAGSVGRRQNESIIAKYGLKNEMKPISDFGDTDCQNIILVDSSKMNDIRFGNVASVITEPIVIVDHHDGSTFTEDESSFYLVELIGSASTLMEELFLALGFNLDQLDLKLYAMLAIGIYSDTKALSSASSRDLKAYEVITNHVKYGELNEFIYYSLPSSHYNNMAYALVHRSLNRGRLVASAGFLPPEQGDDLASIADYLIREETVHVVVIWAIVGDTVQIKARCDSTFNISLCVFLEKSFGTGSGAKTTPNGSGEGGASLQIKLSDWITSPEPDEDTKKALLFLIDTRIKQLVFA